MHTYSIVAVQRNLFSEGRVSLHQYHWGKLLCTICLCVLIPHYLPVLILMVHRHSKVQLANVTILHWLPGANSLFYISDLNCGKVQPSHTWSHLQHLHVCSVNRSNLPPNQHAWKVSQRNQRGKEARRGFEQFEVWKMFWVQTEKKLMTESQNRERTEDLLKICWRSKYQITILEKLRSILNVDFLSFIFQL